MYPALFVFLANIDFNRTETNAYKTQLDSLSLFAFEEVFSNESRLKYLYSNNLNQETIWDSVYSIEVCLDYSFIANNENRITGRRDKPHLRANWVIRSPNNEVVACITTSNRLLIVENNIVRPRQPIFRNIYSELAYQSAESFIAVLYGEDENHIPSSPITIKNKSDANVVTFEYGGRAPFISDIQEYFNFVHGGLSRHQYLVSINRGKTAGFSEGKHYKVLIPAKANDESAPDDNTGDNLNNALDISNEAYRVIGRFEALSVDEDVSIGIIRLYRKYSNSYNYVFSDEAVRGYSFYNEPIGIPRAFPRRN